MVQIRQHGPNGELFDITSFLGDIDHFFCVDQWRVRVWECVGKEAIQVEPLTAEEQTLSDRDFRAMYRGVHQTIDGSFVALAGGHERCRLEAVDSSFWEITATPEFEAHMMAKYGRYGG
jgi:hypothetical protein